MLMSRIIASTSEKRHSSSGMLSSSRRALSIKQLQAFARRDAIGPVRIGDGGAANGNQVVTVIQRFIHIRGIHHAANAHYRYLRQRVERMAQYFSISGVGS